MQSVSKAQFQIVTQLNLQGMQQIAHPKSQAINDLKQLKF